MNNWKASYDASSIEIAFELPSQLPLNIAANTELNADRSARWPLISLISLVDSSTNWKQQSTESAPKTFAITFVNGAFSFGSLDGISAVVFFLVKWIIWTKHIKLLFYGVTMMNLYRFMYLLRFIVARLAPDCVNCPEMVNNNSKYVFWI